MIHRKRVLVRKAEADNDWALYVDLHERPYRFHAFAGIAGRLSNEQYWSILRSIYVDSENLFEIQSLPDLLGSERPQRAAHFMQTEERELLATLPQRFVIYRGANSSYEEQPTGVSWTLSYPTAFFFARRFWSPDEGDVEPIVFRALCSRDDVQGLLLGRRECEVVVNPTVLTHIAEVPEPLDDEVLGLWHRCKERMGDNGQVQRWHGQGHWFSVDRFGQAIAKVVDCDLAVVRAFAYLHDCCRLTEEKDPDHGRRAAAFAEELYSEDQGKPRNKQILRLKKHQLKLLVEACAEHSEDKTSADPTIGACWDATRLDLLRINRFPRRDLFSSQAAFDLAFQV